ncbi:NAC domain-containing protein 82-like [Forsythia ovata]|uniref:NAC domain-containing protein 82-like n=1 Tax=Forsythia ovata TaxID=205694 RepID=A0ABD1UTW7_9LAMI
MARTSLPPGFRFHPTDVELVMYYLKRKVMGKKLHFEAIAEVNIYKFSPWDLPDKSCLKSKDLEWFFYCPREKRYASGVRVKRSTENGYWKTTGKDRPVFYNNNIVGMVKTLIFHLGHAPHGQRTDWVIHEFRILDNQLVESGVQDTYVLCKVFKKNGLGPKNGAQYGAPFNEADWDNDDGTLICSESLPSDDPNRSFSVITSMAVPRSTSGLSLIEAGPSSAGPSCSDMVLDESDDDIVHLLAPFTDHSMLHFNEQRIHEDHDNDEGNNISLPSPNGNDMYNGLGDLDNWVQMTEGGKQDHDNDEGNNTSLPSPNGNDMYSGLGDLDNWVQMTEGGFDTTGVQDGYLNNHMLPQDDAPYLELNDLIAPLDFCPEVNATEEISIGKLFVPYSPGNMDCVRFRGDFSGMNWYASGLSQHPVLPEGSNRQEGCSDVLQMVNSNDVNVNLGNNSPNDLHFTCSETTEECSIIDEVALTSYLESIGVAGTKKILLSLHSNNYSTPSLLIQHQLQRTVLFEFLCRLLYACQG